MSYNKSNSSGRKRNTAKSAAALLIPLAPVTIDLIKELSDKISTPTKKHIVIRPLYSKDESIDIDKAVEILKGHGLKAEPVKLYIKDAKAEYKDCFNFQVIDQRFTKPYRVDIGLPVIIRYITQDVIDESKKMFEESERQKAKKKKAKFRRSSRWNKSEK